jgi:hypothetical protein
VAWVVQKHDRRAIDAQRIELLYSSQGGALSANQTE